ncbi:MAG: sulfotransferase domain-containing protein [Xanthomonadaceae bacterium]|nr:sulfotransferase domain-containing protein [Xanthomonadaceae bacterium]MDE2225152.1 sulfotransferase domain-containing protein [Xanthomonadaceae bacterium]
MPELDKPFPTGLVIGPMRTGSTWLYEYLSSRADVCLPRDVKETFYFAENYGKGEDWYESHFRHYDPAHHRAIIDVSPTLFPNHDAIARVRKDLRNPVLMATLRQPIDRAWSHYMHLRQYGATNLDFDTAVREIPAIIDASLYAKHLACWLDEFGRGAVRITFYSDLKKHQAEYVRQVNEAFGLPATAADTLPAAKVNSGSLPRNLLLAQVTRRAAATLRRSGLHPLVNAGKRIGLSNLVYGRSRGAAAQPKMRPGTRGYLAERFATDLDDLERLLNIKLDAWREQRTPPRKASRQA